MVGENRYSFKRLFQKTDPCNGAPNLNPKIMNLSYPITYNLFDELHNWC